MYRYRYSEKKGLELMLFMARSGVGGLLLCQKRPARNLPSARQHLRLGLPFGQLLSPGGWTTPPKTPLQRCIWNHNANNYAREKKRLSRFYKAIFVCGWIQRHADWWIWWILAQPMRILWSLLRTEFRQKKGITARVSLLSSIPPPLVTMVIAFSSSYIIFI